jgi:hypothetical protein
MERTVTLETTRRSVFADVDLEAMGADKQRVVLTLPAQQKDYEKFIAKGWVEVK